VTIRSTTRHALHSFHHFHEWRMRIVCCYNVFIVGVTTNRCYDSSLCVMLSYITTDHNIRVSPSRRQCYAFSMSLNKSWADDRIFWDNPPQKGPCFPCKIINLETNNKSHNSSLLFIHKTTLHFATRRIRDLLYFGPDRFGGSSQYRTLLGVFQWNAVSQLQVKI
jgi:hypothetical protein